jgi:hypothetical protein
MDRRRHVPPRPHRPPEAPDPVASARRSFEHRVLCVRERTTEQLAWCRPLSTGVREGRCNSDTYPSGVRREPWPETDRPKPSPAGTSAAPSAPGSGIDCATRGEARRCRTPRYPACGIRPPLGDKRSAHRSRLRFGRRAIDAFIQFAAGGSDRHGVQDSVAGGADRPNPLNLIRAILATTEDGCRRYRWRLHQGAQHHAASELRATLIGRAIASAPPCVVVSRRLMAWAGSTKLSSRRNLRQC